MTAGPTHLQDQMKVPKGSNFVKPELVQTVNEQSELLRQIEVRGNLEIEYVGERIILTGRRGGGSGMMWFRVKRHPTVATTVIVGQGYGCYAGTWTEISDGTKQVGTLIGANTYYIYARLRFDTGAWDVNKFGLGLPTNSTVQQFYLLAKVVNDGSDNLTITQLFDQWCIYENRI